MIGKFFIIDFKLFFQYLNFCNKTNKFSAIDKFNHKLLTSYQNILHNIFWLSYVKFEYPSSAGYGTI